MDSYRSANGRSAPVQDPTRFSQMTSLRKAAARLDGFLERHSTYWVVLFFVGYLLLGLFLFRDYGVGFDEENCRQRGILAYNYVVYNDQTLLTYDRKFMGQLFDMSLAAVEKNFSVFKDTREIYFMRHLAIFLSFYIGVIFFYRLCLQRFNSWKIALLGCFLLVSSPRLFAHSFYNAKDIPFLAAVIASMFTLNRFLDRKDRASALWHGLACAIAAGVRPVGLFMVALTTAFYA